MMRMTDEEMMSELQSDSVLNKARKIFNGQSAKIEQVMQQSRPISPIEMRRMEFEAVQKIQTILNESVNSELAKLQIENENYRVAISDLELGRDVRREQLTQTRDNVLEEAAKALHPALFPTDYNYEQAKQAIRSLKGGKS